MKLIALALFLLSISSNAFAKVEIWDCELVRNLGGTDFKPDRLLFKIDTKKLRIYTRDKGKWVIDEWKTGVSENSKYDKENDSIIIDLEYNYFTIAIFDLTANTYERYVEDDQATIYECEEL